jgi:phosphatidate cytidylyltransferase
LVRALAERPAGRWGDLAIRTLSALVLAPIALACVWAGGIAFLVIVTAAAIGLAAEWLAMCRAPASAVLRVAGLTYILLACGALLWLRLRASGGRADVLFLLGVVWAGDIGAYLIGRCIGGPRLAPIISPGKTWSGAVGGLLASVAAGLCAAYFLADAMIAWRVALVAACLGVVAQAGDLLESYVKRRLKVKDSSHLIPGHGGLLDRLDALMAGALVAALLALTLGGGVVLWQ